MAKTKTKKEKIVDLKPKADKVTNEQLKRVQGVVDRINSTHMSIGQLEARKHQALHFLAGVNDELSLFQAELKDDYGTADIDIQTGSIKYPENGEADKKD